MKQQGRILALTAAAAVMALIGCKQASEPPPDNPPAKHIVVMRDSAFTLVEATTGNGIFDYPWGLSLNNTLPPMKLDTTVGRLPAYNGSITTDSNNTALQLIFFAMEDSLTLAYDSCRTLVLEFYLKADTLCHTNFIAFLGKEGGSNRNSTRYVGMGFDALDSVKYVYSVDMTTNEQSKNVAQMQLHHWYKCSTEFDFTDTTVAYYLDNALVGHIHFQPTNIQAIVFDMFVIYRNGSGANGPAPYYLNDLTIYKK
jgi:hypothetical protein